MWTFTCSPAKTASRSRPLLSCSEYIGTPGLQLNFPLRNPCWRNVWRKKRKKEKNKKKEKKEYPCGSSATAVKRRPSLRQRQERQWQQERWWRRQHVSSLLLCLPSQYWGRALPGTEAAAAPSHPLQHKNKKREKKKKRQPRPLVYKPPISLSLPTGHTANFTAGGTNKQQRSPVLTIIPNDRVLSSSLTIVMFLHSVWGDKCRFMLFYCALWCIFFCIFPSSCPLCLICEVVDSTTIVFMNYFITSLNIG